MKYRLALILLLFMGLLSCSDIFAQHEPSAAETAENLRTQLRDVQAREAELNFRVHQLDWDLKPENIERYFSAVGTTRPEELREQRRRQLQLEKEQALVQLDQLATSRARLETAIGTADAQAYHDSAWAPTALQASKAEGGQNSRTFILLGVLGFIAIGAALTLTAVLRRR